MAQDTKTKTVVEEAVPEKRPRKEPPPPRYAPNIIPLIDVLFMLLLYFLLSTRFRQMEGDIQGSLPGSPGSEPATVRPEEVYIKVRPVGEDHMKAIYELTGKNLALESADSLYQALERFQKEFSPDTPVLIEPTGDVRWAFVVEAFNQSVRARFKNIGFVAN
jgi:biopolymer transport protein ExbD